MMLIFRLILPALLVVGLDFGYLTMAYQSRPEGWPIKVGSKKFTENVILGEIIGQLAHSAGLPVKHRRQLGGTRLLWNALKNGDIDIYPEYTGTIRREILLQYNVKNDSDIGEMLARFGVKMSSPLGFNNTYALGLLVQKANALGIKTISDLRRFPDLKFGFTNEFMNRSDGWQGLKDHYSLPQKFVRGLDHDLAYRGINRDSIQVIDIYSTDAEIKYYNLKTLVDDLGYFPKYDAVLLYREEIKERAPQFLAKINSLAGKISAENMSAMNAKVKILRIPDKQVAADFILSNYGIPVEIDKEGFWQRLWKHTTGHLGLVSISLFCAILVAIPLGIIAVKITLLEKLILSLVGIIQTIPSLALLVFMIPLLGIGGPPAVVALFLYSLLPIVRNTYTGIRNIPSGIRESAVVLGLPPTARLRLVEIPLALRTILAGIKTSAVINVGTATLGALIGAGGFGQPILTGIRLDDIGMILEGAVPAAILAIGVQGLFDLLEKIIVPKGLRF